MIAAFGLPVALGLPVPELDGVPACPATALPRGPELRVQAADRDEIDAAWSGPRDPPVVAGAVVDGAAWTAERGRDWDLRMEHALGRFLLDPAATLLRCAPTRAADPAWRRLLLDTALVTASLARGHDALHAGCAVKNGSAVAIAGASGAGKTSLLLELLRAGARFLSDDVIAVRDEDGQILAYPGPPLANFPASEGAEGLGERLHRFGPEWWVRIRDPWMAPAPIRMVVVLERPADPTGAPPLLQLDEPAAALLAHALHGGSTPERREQRFALLSGVAASAEVISVNASRFGSPREIASRLCEAVSWLRA